MKLTITKCNLKGCNNITTDILEKEFGSYCFLHSSYTYDKFYHDKDAFVSKSKLVLSPTSSRQVVVENTEKVEYTNYNYKPLEVSSRTYSVPSPSRKYNLVNKTECGLCKVMYPESNLMKCGHLVCEECLRGIVKSPYCPFCEVYMEGPYVTEEIMELIETKYKKNIEEDESSSSSDEESLSSEESSDEEEYENFDEEIEKDSL
jgi:hypothetical protein